MKMKTSLATALVFCALSTQATLAEPLSAQDIRKLAPGQYHVNIMGLVKMTVALRTNGSISGKTSKGKRDTGSWSVQGEKFCVTWNRWLKAKRRCSALTGANGSYSGSGFSLRRI
jgi:hypothetical protein